MPEGHVVRLKNGSKCVIDRKNEPDFFCHNSKKN